MTRADAKARWQRQHRRTFIREMLKSVAIHNPGSYPSHKREWMRYVIRLADK